MKVSVYAGFDKLPSVVTDRFSYPSQNNYFLSLDWFQVHYETVLSSKMTPLIYVVYSDMGCPEALFCAGIDSDSGEFVGQTSFYTVEYGLSVIEKKFLIEAAKALIIFLSKEEPKKALLEIRVMRTAHIGEMQLLKILASKGWGIERYFQYENWYLPCHEVSFEEYYQSRSSRLRNTIKRKENKLKKAHEVRVELITDAGDALNQAVLDYVKVYNHSWKNEEPYPDYTPEMMKRCAEKGVLRLGLLYIDEQPAAVQWWITTQKRAMIYKLAYDEKFAEYSPGSILSRDLFRHALDVDCVEEIDYGVGSESYKREWMSEVRLIEGIRAYNKRTLQGVIASVRIGVKKWIKPLRE